MSIEIDKGEKIEMALPLGDPLPGAVMLRTDIPLNGGKFATVCYPWPMSSDQAALFEKHIEHFLLTTRMLNQPRWDREKALAESSGQFDAEVSALASGLGPTATSE